MGEVDGISKIKEDLKNYNDYLVKIDYLERFLRESSETIELQTIAEIYELLGELYIGGGNPKGSYFQKAAASYETLSVLNLSSNGIDRESLKKAYSNYKKALKIFKEDENFALKNEVEKNLGEVSARLFKEIGPMKKLTIASVMITFVISFFLVSSSFTGFVVVPLDKGDTTFTGFIFVIMGLIGMFIVSRWLLR